MKAKCDQKWLGERKNRKLREVSLLNEGGVVECLYLCFIYLDDEGCFIFIWDVK